jgi:thymidylate synthase (FAD)
MNDNCIPVLDHGHVRLVEYMGSDLSVVRNARVSYDAEWRAGADEGKDEKLIHYLAKNQHTSPFEAVQFTFDIKCPIFVARQWHRHRTWAYNEVSARYAALLEEFYVPKVEDITTQSTDNKQMRTNEPHPNASILQGIIRDHCVEAFGRYRVLLQAGCPRELARGVLPVNTYTHFFATVDLLNLMKFLKLRLHPHAQMEIRVYAEAMLKLITPIVPVSVSAWYPYLGV